MRSTSASDILATLAVPARWPLISTSTWLLKSRPWPSVAAPRMLIEVWPGVHSLRKPTAFWASRSATDFAVERSMADRSMICTGPTTRPAGPGGRRAACPSAGGAPPNEGATADDLNRAGHALAWLRPPARGYDHLAQID